MTVPRIIADELGVPKDVGRESRPRLVHSRPCHRCGGDIETGTGLYIPSHGLACDTCAKLWVPPNTEHKEKT